ncbi:MAG: trimeric autotransporter adhesin, partial [Chloroflexota bacterium]|nr:trimeric autotransporter adhesin [Chloroflexota bacterium]
MSGPEPGITVGLRRGVRVRKLGTLIFGVLLLTQLLLAPVAALAATIQTDLFVYQNGDTVTVTGDGFGPSETVDLVTTDPNATVVNRGGTTTDDQGSFTYQFTLNVTIAGLYDVNATGETSGLTASTRFDPPPEPPADLKFTDNRAANGGAVSLSWTAKGNQSVDCYWIYRATSLMAPRAINQFGDTNNTCTPAPSAVFTVVSGGSISSFSDASATTGNDYYYYVTAVKQGNNQGESMSSNEVSTASLKANASSGSHDFGGVAVGVPSGAFPLTYTNNGPAAITVRSITKSGTNPADFSVSGAPAAGTVVNTGGTIQLSVTFTATATGARSGNIEVNASDNGFTGSPVQSAGVFNTHVVPVSGSGATATSLAVQSTSGTYGGTTNLTATLAPAASGKSIVFSLNGHTVGNASTIASGVATLTGASLGSVVVGTYGNGVAASWGGDAFLAPSSATASLTVSKAMLSVTANPVSRAFGANNPSLTAAITGFQNGETLGTSGVTGSPSCGSTADATSTVGDYVITCAAGTLSSVNYSFSFVNGTLHVGKATLMVNAADASKVYGDVDPTTFTYTFSGFVNGDSAGSVTISGSATCSLAAGSGPNVGTYSKVITC